MFRMLRTVAFLAPLVASATAFADPLTYGEVELIKLAAKAIFNLSITESYSNNMHSILANQCGDGSCSDREICQILNLGAVFPMDCSGLSDTPAPPEDEREVAFRTFLSALPDPQVCVDYFGSLRPGTLQIDLDGNGDPRLQQCFAERAAIRQSLTAKKDQVLAKLGYGPNGEILGPPPAPPPPPKPTPPRCFDSKGHQLLHCGGGGNL